MPWATSPCASTPRTSRAGERPFTLEVRDGVNWLAAQSRVTNLAVTSAPAGRRRRAACASAAAASSRRAPSSRTICSAASCRRPFGSRPGRTAPCGTFSVKRRQIPVENARTGSWMLQIDQKKAYDPQPDPVWVRLPIEVSETFGSI